MNALVPAEQTRPAPMLTGGRIQPIVPQSMEDAYRLGKAICTAGMAPRGMDTPEKAMIAIMRGLEVGLTPMQALDKIAVVNGRPTIWGDGAMALVRGSGLCEFVRERIDGEGDARVAVCESKRRGETEAVARSFSVAEAKEAGLWNKQGPWKQFPARMLQMRARAFTLRDLYADVLGGLYLREEIEDERKQRSDDPPPAPRQIASDAPRTIEHQPSRDTAQEGKPVLVQDAETAGAKPPASQVSASANSEQAVDVDADGVVTMESLLADLDERLSFGKTPDDIEEGYTDFDAEALLCDYDGGVEAARALKAKHLDRLPAAAAKSQPAPVDDFPGNDAIEAGKKPGIIVTSGLGEKDPFALPERFKGGGHYQIWISRAAEASQVGDAERLTKCWNDTKPIRAEMRENGQLADSDLKILLQRVKDALDRIAEPSPPDEQDLPPPAPRAQKPQQAVEASQSAQPAAETPEPVSDDPVAAYTAKMEAAFGKAQWKEEVDRWWFSTTDERDEQTGADEEQRAKWRLARNKAKSALPSAEG